MEEWAGEGRGNPHGLGVMRIGEVVTDRLGDAPEAVAHRVGVHEERPGCALDPAVVVQVGRCGLEQVGTSAFLQGAHDWATRAPRAGCSPLRARSASRSSARTGRGALGQAGAEAYPEIAARAERPAAKRCGTTGPTTTGPSPR